MPGPHTGVHLPPGVGHRMLVALVGCCLMLQPISTDLYLASLPGLTRTFAASIGTVQLTLSVWVAAFGTMQLVAGPLSDRYGRRAVTTGGLALYIASSALCAAAPTIEWLVAGRLFQAIGCCAAVVVARAIVRDVYAPAAGARALAQASTVLAIGPIVGPILGSMLEVRFGHRAAFVTHALLACLLLAATFSRLGETNRHLDAAATRLRPLVANYAHVLRSREFIAWTLVASASYGGLFAFISGSSFVLIRVLGVPTELFGFGFAFCVTGYLAGTLLCRRLLARRSVARTLRTGAALSLASGLTMAALSAAGVHHWAAVIGPAFGFLFAHGINFPCGQAASVSPFPRHAGAAAGMFGFAVMAIAAATGTWMGYAHDGTVRPLAYTMAAFSAVVFATAWGWIARLRTAGAASVRPEA